MPQNIRVMQMRKECLHFNHLIKQVIARLSLAFY